MSTPPHASPRARRPRPLSSTLSLASCAWLWIGAAAHLLVPDSGPLTVAAHATAGWWWTAALACALLALASRHRPTLGAAAATLLLVLTWTIPGTLGAEAATGKHTLAVGVANVLSSNPQADELLGELAAAEPDVVGLIELRDHHRSLVDRHFAPARWQRRRVIPRPDNFGIGVLGGPACGEPWAFDVEGVPWLAIPVRVGGAAVQIWVAHTLPPVSADYHAVWRAQLRFLASQPGPQVVLADLNLTRHNPTFRALGRAGYRDAFARAGRAGLRTWTPFRRGPDLLRLDHVLVRGDVAVSDVELLPRRGSDHRTVVARLRLP